MGTKIIMKPFHNITRTVIVMHDQTTTPPNHVSVFPLLQCMQSGTSTTISTCSFYIRHQKLAHGRPNRHVQNARLPSFPRIQHEENPALGARTFMSRLALKYGKSAHDVSLRDDQVHTSILFINSIRFTTTDEVGNTRSGGEFHMYS
jgi:hypothetical protein